MKISILETAQIELKDAIDYYNYESPGLGKEFLIEIQKTLDLIMATSKNQYFHKFKNEKY